MNVNCQHMVRRQYWRQIQSFGCGIWEYMGSRGNSEVRSRPIYAAPHLVKRPSCAYTISLLIRSDFILCISTLEVVVRSHPGTCRDNLRSVPCTVHIGKIHYHYLAPGRLVFCLGSFLAQLCTRVCEGLYHHPTVFTLIITSVHG